MAVQARYISKTNTNNPGMQHQYDMASNAVDSRKRSRDIMMNQNQFDRSNISQQSLELDALVRLHNDNLRSGLEQFQKKNYRKLLQIFEYQAGKQIAEKDLEIQKLKARQTELEMNLRKIHMENEILINVVKNSENVISNLKARLVSEVMKQKAGECHVANGQVEDLVSCCYEGDSGDRSLGAGRLCKRCNERDVSVVLVPCRHLCLCLECEPVTDTCPICFVGKNVGFHVLFGEG